MEALREALREALAGLRGAGGGGGGEAFDRGRFWEALAGAFGAASREATRLSLAASRAQMCERLSQEVRNATIGAVLVYYQLPESQGRALNNAVRCATIQLVEGMIQLVEVILRTPQESCLLAALVPVPLSLLQSVSGAAYLNWRRLGGLRPSFLLAS